MQPLILLSLLAFSARAFADVTDTDEAAAIEEALAAFKSLSNTNLSDFLSLTDQAPECTRDCLGSALKEVTAPKCKITGQKGEKVDWGCFCKALSAGTKDDDAISKSLDKLQIPQCQNIKCDGSKTGLDQHPETVTFVLSVGKYCAISHPDSIPVEEPVEGDARSKGEKSGAAPSSKVGNLGLAGLLLGGVVGFIACSF